MTTITDKIAAKKSSQIRQKIPDAIVILPSAGVPIDDLTPGRLEKMAISFPGSLQNQCDCLLG